MSVESEIALNNADADFNAVVPLDRGSDGYQAPEFICPVVEVKPEDLQDIKQEPADECDNDGMHCCVNVPLHRESYDYCTQRQPVDRTFDGHQISEFTYQVEVMPEHRQDVKEEPDDEDDDDLHYSTKV